MEYMSVSSQANDIGDIGRKYSNVNTHRDRYGECCSALHQCYKDYENGKDFPAAKHIDPPRVKALDPCRDYLERKQVSKG